MGMREISIDYGDYTNFGYKKKETTFELTWDTPDGLEAKYVKTYDEAIASALDELQDSLVSGTVQAKKWLSEMDDKLSDIFAKWNKTGAVTKKEAELCDTLQAQLPDFIETLEKQRKKIFESMLDKIVDKAGEKLAKKLSLKIDMAKVKKGLKIAGIAVLFITVTALALTATILTFGVAAGPILACVAGFLSLGTGVVRLSMNAKSIWSSGKDEAKNLETTAKSYADAAKSFDEVLARQQSQITAKKLQLASLTKQLDEIAKTKTQLDGMKKNLADVTQKRIDDVDRKHRELDKARSDLEDDVARQEKLLGDAVGKRTYESAVVYAASLKDGSAKIDTITGIVEAINNNIGGVSAVLSACGH